MKLILVRHGESEANAAGLLAGRRDFALTSRGEDQAHSAGLVAAEMAGLRVARVLSSPLSRCRRTATPIAAAARVAVEPAAEWIELDYGSWDGRALADVSSAQWREWRGDPDWAPPGGESLRSVHDRVAAAIERLRLEAVGSMAPHKSRAESGDDRGGAAGDVVVVSHVSPIKAAICWALGVGPEASWKLRLEPAAWVELDLVEPALLLLSAVDRLRPTTAEP